MDDDLEGLGYHHLVGFSVLVEHVNPLDAGCQHLCTRSCLDERITSNPGIKGEELVALSLLSLGDLDGAGVVVSVQGVVCHLASLELGDGWVNAFAHPGLT